MIGKVLGGIAGAKAAKRSSEVGGAKGALLGAVSVGLLKRVSIPALLAIGAGGYAYKKWSDRREAAKAKRKSFETPPTTAQSAA